MPSPWLELLLSVKKKRPPLPVYLGGKRENYLPSFLHLEVTGDFFLMGSQA